MHPAYETMKSVDLSEWELIALGFMGNDAAPYIRETVEKVRANPELLGSITCYMIDCVIPHQVRTAQTSHEP